jgi:PAS domain S-box-containing protein
VHPYPLLLAVSSVVTAVCAGCIFSHAPRRRDSQTAALLLAGVSWWGLCQVAWNVAPDPETARSLMRLSAPGWLFVGPLVLQIYAGANPRASAKVRRLLPALYITCAGFLVLEWTTDLVLYDVAATSWGWAFMPGPLFPIHFGVQMIGIGRTCQLIWRSLRRTISQADQRQKPWFLVAVGIPMTITALSDVVLPSLGMRLPPLGTISFAVLGLISVWSVQRYGYFMLSPGNFAPEILRTLPDGVMLVGPDDSIRVANPSIHELAGCEPGELLGLRWPTLLEAVGPARRADAHAGEYELISWGGERVPVSVSTSTLRDRQGATIGKVLVVRDVRELRELRDRVVRSARLAAVGELAAGIAHEINNPMAFVRSNLNQLQSHWKTVSAELDGPIRANGLCEVVDEGNELIEESIEGVDRAAHIVRGIRGFSHAGSHEHEPANVNELIEDVLHMATSQLHSDISVERRYEDVPPVLCAPQELKQVFVNLIVNAGHAVGARGTIQIRSQRDGDDVVIHVIDDGEGIPGDIIDRVFDPFFTTKRVGEGTGLGLGIAYQITKSHGGEINVESVLGEGSHFRVRLPAHLV